MAEISVTVPIDVQHVLMQIKDRHEAFEALQCAIVVADRFSWDADMQAAIDKLYEELVK